MLAPWNYPLNLEKISPQFRDDYIYHKTICPLIRLVAWGGSCCHFFNSLLPTQVCIPFIVYTNSPYHSFPLAKSLLWNWTSIHFSHYMSWDKGVGVCSTIENCFFCVFLTKMQRVRVSSSRVQVLQVSSGVKVQVRVQLCGLGPSPGVLRHESESETRGAEFSQLKYIIYLFGKKAKFMRSWLKKLSWFTVVDLISETLQFSWNRSKGENKVQLVKWFFSYRLHTGACANLALLTSEV